MLGRVANTRILIIVKASDAFGHNGQRNSLVGVHRRTQSGEIDNDRVDCLRIAGYSTNRRWPPLIRSSETMRYIAHAQPSRQSSWSVLGRNNRLTGRLHVPV